MKKKLTFRNPTAADIKAVGGLPLTIDLPDRRSDPPAISFNAKRMSAMMALLSGKPIATIYRLPAHEWTTYAWTLAAHFVPRIEIQSEPSGHNVVIFRTRKR